MREPWPYVSLTSSSNGNGLALLAVFTSVAAAGMVWGTMIPLLTVLMERDGVPAVLIGLNSAMPVLAVIVTSRLMPWIGRRVGLAPAMFGGLLVIAAGTLALPYFRSYGAWLVLRFVIGLAAAVHWILSEAWINTLAPRDRRGLYVGLYGTIILGGFALGPLILTLIEIDGVLPFALIAGAVLVAGVPLFLLRRRLPPLDDGPHQASLSLFLMAPAVFFAALIAGITEGALWTLLTVYGIDKGLGETGALHLLAALNVGTVVLQLPIGWLADRIGATVVLTICSAAGLAGSLVLPQLVTGWAVPLLWAFAFVWGAFLASLYTVALIELGRRFEGVALANANGLFVSGYCAGGLFGPLAIGLAMDQAGADALPAAVGIASALYLVVAAVQRVRR